MGLIKSEFKEEKFQSYVEYALKYDFLGGPEFSIEYCNDERRKGYDLEVKSYIPIFFQIKRSDYYPSNDTSSIMTKRKEWKLKDTTGAYCFPLRLDRVDKDYNQHNLLVDLNTNNCYARYLAPIFYQEHILEKLSYSMRKLHWPIMHNMMIDESFNDEPEYYYWRDYVTLPMSITILPHKKVHKQPGEVHKYAFNRYGETSFHSEPEKVERGLALDHFLFNMRRLFFKGESISFELLIKHLTKIISKNIFVDENLAVYKDKYEKNFLEILYYEIFDVEIDSSEDIWKKIISLSNHHDTFKFLIKYLEKRHDINTYLLSWS